MKIAVVTILVVFLTGCSVNLGSPEYRVTVDGTTETATSGDAGQECGLANPCDEGPKVEDSARKKTLIPGSKVAFADPENPIGPTDTSPEPITPESSSGSSSKSSEEENALDTSLVEGQAPFCVKAPRPTYHATFPGGKITMTGYQWVSGGTTLKFGIELQDSSGSRMAPTDSQELRITISGPGLTVNALPERFPPEGLVEFSHIVGSNDSGIVFVRAELVDASTGSRLAVIQRYVHVGYGVHSLTSGNQIYVSIYIQNDNRAEIHCNSRRMLWISSGGGANTMLSELWSSPEPGVVEVVSKGVVIESIPFG